MLRHYLKLAYRTLWRNKFHATINVIGLAIGISACLVIYLIVSHELSFNKNISNHDYIYRVHSKFSGPFSGLNRGAPSAVAPFVKENFKGVESVSMFFIFASKVEIPTSAEKKKFDREDGVILADHNYFDVIQNYTWLSGAPEALKNPNQVVLTQQQARKYFGEQSPDEILGKEIIYRDSLVTTVAGVVRDLDFETDFFFTDFISSKTIESTWLKQSFKLDDWQNVNSSTQVFIRTSPSTTTQDLQDQLPLLSKKYSEVNTWATNHFNIQPLSDLHYNTTTQIFDQGRSAAHIPTLLTLIGVAALLLVIGAINFINLETAQAIRRAKEVGVRKVLGSSRTRLVMQFLSEGMLITLIAVILALPLTEIGLTYFKEFIPDGVALDIQQFIPFAIGIVIFIGVLASTYPAFVLSSFLPALALKNQVGINSSQSRSSFLRKTLIIVQFTFAQALILGTLMIASQINFVLKKDLGFTTDAIIYFHAPWWEDKAKRSLLANELNTISEIEQLAMSDAPPAENGWSSSVIEFKSESQPEPVKFSAYRKFGDEHFIDLYGITLVEGRNLQPSDTVKEILINETMVQRLGFNSPIEALGQLIKVNNALVPIVGVMHDYNIQSLHTAVEPVMMGNMKPDFSCYNVKLNTANKQGDDLKAALEKIETAWKKIYPDAPFKYTFLDDTVKGFYETEQRTAKLSKIAMAMAIFISCLGLFGLASYTTTQRTKEIGIRKVFGASVHQIVQLLSRDFIVLVIVAFVFAAPVAWYGIKKWLEGFSYKTDISLWLYVITASVAILVAFVTVSYQTFTAANTNPAKSLRNE